MVDYKIIKHCRVCKVRYVVNKAESKKNYCDACEVKVFKKDKNEEDKG